MRCHVCDGSTWVHDRRGGWFCLFCTRDRKPEIHVFQKPTDAQLENKFAHHPPKGDQAERYAENRKKFLELAKHVRDTTPCSPEQTLAIGRIYEAMMLANGAIAVNE